MTETELDRLTSLALEHWQEFRPAMVRALKTEGRLEASARSAAQQTLSELTSLTASGQTPEAAWETVRERYLLLPAETLHREPSDLSPLIQELMQIHREFENLE